MTETTNGSASIDRLQPDSARTIENFLTAMQNHDIDSAGAALDENLAYQNVGFPTIRGRARAMKLFRSMQGRVGF